MFKNYGDITKIDGSKVETVDCVIGGSPCQDLSIAGNKQGLSGSQSRLFLEQMRVIEEMRISSNGTKPRYMVWENVTNSLSCSKGKDFQRVLMECVNVAIRTSSNRGENKKETSDENSEKYTTIPDVPMPKDGKWPRSGILYDDMGRWSIAWRVHDAQYWGVAQRRRRISLVCDFGGMSAPEVLFERKSVQWNLDTCNTQGKRTTKGVIRGFTESDTESYIYDARGNGTGKLASALTGDHDNRIIDYTNVIVENREINNKLPTICIGNGQSHVTEHYTEEVAQTLNCMHDPMTILEPTDTYKYLVRRLTPLECTRLQGFPDHWVDIGEWVDSKGKKHKETDAPKYKALGNSIALPFWKWLCRNIVNKIKEANRDVDYIPTMGSLFAGIGGFDLCWNEATKNKDSVLWVSEIEEFPIAVLKHNFG